MKQQRLKFLAISCAALLLLFVLALGGLVIYLKSMDFNAYKPLLKQSVFEATGRNLEIDGIVALELSLHPLLIVEGLHLANIKAGSRANMINVERMEVQISLLGLLEGKLEVDRVVLLAPNILLETLPSGLDNWSFEPRQDQTGEAEGQHIAQSGTLFMPQIRRLFIRDAQLIYRDSQAEGDISLQLQHLEMQQLPNETRLSLHGSGKLNDHDLEFSGMMDDLPALLANKPIQLQAFQAKFAGLHASFSANIAQPLDVQGVDLKLNLQTDSIMQVAQAADIVLPRDFPLSMQMTIKDTTHGLHISNMRANMADNDLSGKLSLNFKAKRPSIDAVISSTSFDVKRFFSLEKKESDSSTIQQGAKPRLFSDQHIDFSILKIADITLALKMKQLTLAKFKLFNLDTRIHLFNGVLSLKPFVMGIAEGKVTGSLRVASGRSPAHLTAKFHFSDIQPSLLLSVDPGQKTLIEGAPINADIQLVGQGKSMAEIMAHANGVLLVKMGKGRIQSKALRLIGGDVLMNLVNTLNPFSKKMNYNQLRCGIIHFRINKGKMLTRKGIAFETDRMNIISSGHVNLHSEKIDLSISTETREGLGLNISNMVNVVKLGGTLLKPGVSVDAVKTGLAAARTVGAFATGGLSLLGESIFSRITADSSACETALNMQL